MTVAANGWRRLALGAVIVAAAVLRFAHLNAGFPHRIGADEPVILERATHILRTGDFNPHFFDYPGLYIYAQAAVAAARFVSGAMSGEWQRLTEFTNHDVYPWTRAVNAALGTFTVYLTYRAGLRWGTWPGIIAAALLAFWGNHVRESHFALTDVPLTTFVAAGLVVSLRTTEDPRHRNYALAGMLLGCAAAVKYNGAIALLMPLAGAAWTTPARAFWPRAVTTAGAAAAAYLVSAPYTVLDLPGFLDGFAHLSLSYLPRPLSSGLAIYAGHLAASIGWPAVVLVAIGLLWTLVRDLRSSLIARPVVLMVFPVVYLYVIATKNLIYGRYLLPLLPGLSVGMAVLLADVTRAVNRWSSRPRWVRLAAIAALWLLATAKLATTGVSWVRVHGERTTQDVAYDALRQFIPRGAGVAIERGVMWLPERDYRTDPVQSLADRSIEEHQSAGITHVVATSTVYGPILSGSAGTAEAQERYRRLFRGDICLPPFRPRNRIVGPEIRICRLPD